MSVIPFQITSLTIDYSTAYSGADQREHQSPASLAFLPGIHRWPVNSPHKGRVTRKMFPLDDVTMHVGRGTKSLWAPSAAAHVCPMRVLRLAFKTWWLSILFDWLSMANLRHPHHPHHPLQNRVDLHYSDVIMSLMASQITGVSIVCSAVCASKDKKNN